MNSQHSVCRFSIGAGLLRTTVPKILSWPNLSHLGCVDFAVISGEPTCGLISITSQSTLPHSNLGQRSAIPKKQPFEIGRRTRRESTHRHRTSPGSLRTSVQQIARASSPGRTHGVRVGKNHAGGTSHRFAETTSLYSFKVRVRISAWRRRTEKSGSASSI